MKNSNPANTLIPRNTCRALGEAMLIALAAFLLQGCSTARPMWSANGNPKPLPVPEYERFAAQPDAAPRVALVSFSF